MRSETLGLDDRSDQQAFTLAILLIGNATVALVTGVAIDQVPQIVTWAWFTADIVGLYGVMGGRRWSRHLWTGAYTGVCAAGVLILLLQGSGLPAGFVLRLVAVIVAMRQTALSAASRKRQT